MLKLVRVSGFDMQHQITTFSVLVEQSSALGHPIALLSTTVATNQVDLKSTCYVMSLSDQLEDLLGCLQHLYVGEQNVVYNTTFSKI